MTFPALIVIACHSPYFPCVAVYSMHSSTFCKKTSGNYDHIVRTQTVWIRIMMVVFQSVFSQCSRLHPVADGGGSSHRCSIMFRVAWNMDPSVPHSKGSLTMNMCIFCQNQSSMILQHLPTPNSCHGLS